MSHTKDWLYVASGEEAYDRDAAETVPGVRPADPKWIMVPGMPPTAQDG